MSEIPTFVPGRFQPLVTIQQKPSPTHESFIPDFEPLAEIANKTMHKAYRLASARGGGLQIQASHFEGDKRVLQHLLAARALAGQLSEVEKFHPRVATPLLNARYSVLEPVAKLWSHYGHFEVDGKIYAIEDARATLASHLVELAKVAIPGRVETGEDFEPTFQDIDPTWFNVSDEGELVLDFSLPFPQRKRILSTLLLAPAHYADKRIAGYVEDILRCTRESDLTRLLLSCIAKGFTTQNAYDTAAPRRAFVDQTHMIRNHLRTLFGDNTLAFAHGQTIPAKKLIAIVNRAALICNRMTEDLNFRMKTIAAPRYEGGSRAQLACQEGDVIRSEFPLNLEELTIANAFLLGRIGRNKYQISFEGMTTDILDQLIQASVITG